MTVKGLHIELNEKSKNELVQILNKSYIHLQKEIKDNMNPVMKKSKRVTRSHLIERKGVDTGTYRKNLIVRNSSELSKGYFHYQVGGNKKHYRLTHLLENGHKLVPNRHFFRIIDGNTRAIPHIVYGQELVDKEAVKALEVAIDNAFTKTIK